MELSWRRVCFAKISQTHTGARTHTYYFTMVSLHADTQQPYRATRHSHLSRPVCVRVNPFAPLRKRHECHDKTASLGEAAKAGRVVCRMARRNSIQFEVIDSSQKSYRQPQQTAGKRRVKSIQRSVKKDSLVHKDRYAELSNSKSIISLQSEHENKHTTSNSFANQT